MRALQIVEFKSQMRQQARLPGGTSTNMTAPVPSHTGLPWFWPGLSRDDAARRLEGQPDGTSLARPGPSPGMVSVTTVQHGAVRHIRVGAAAGGHRLHPSDEPNTLSAVMASCTTHRLLHPLYYQSSRGPSKSKVSRLFNAMCANVNPHPHHARTQT